MQQRQSRENNFGSLRLLFATLVIVSHSPLILDGNFSRALLVRFSSTMSSGDVAVDGFFIISGYLITKSYLSSSSTSSYLKKRILRIYPGYLASFWICILIVAPLAGVTRSFFSAYMLLKQLLLSVLLQWPISRGAFAGMPLRNLNRSMWTISFEFACYVCVLCAGRLGFLTSKRRRLLIPVVGLLLVANAYLTPGYFASAVRLGAVFGVGMIYYFYGEHISLSRTGAAFCAAMLIFFLFDHRTAEGALMIFGGYLIFWTAFKLPVFRLSRFANRIDLSYGIYLYAWPIGELIAWKFRAIPAWLLFGTTLAGAATMAYFSWTLVESPALGLLKGQKQRQLVGS